MTTSPAPRPPVRAALRDAGVAALALWLVLFAAFVRHRNSEHASRERGRALASAQAVAAGDTPVHAVSAAGVVRPAVASKQHAFLARRMLVDGKRERALGGPEAPAADKLLYDAAARFEREGPYVAMLTDGTGRAVAVVKTKKGAAVAVTAPPGAPAGMPWLMLIGLVGLGAALAAAGAVSGRGGLGDRKSVV